MAFKFIALFALAAVAVNAGIIPVHHQEIPLEHHHQQPQAVYHSAPVAAHHVSAPQYIQHHVAHEQYPDDPHPQYNFAYDVQDSISGDSKSQTESRDGDVVHGEYSLDDADGFRRTVKYTADDVNGFNAVVHREPLTHHKVIASSAPVQYHHAPTTVVKAPVAYAQPAYSAHNVHHHDQHANTYATYEVPQHDEHQQYYHQQH